MFPPPELRIAALIRSVKVVIAPAIHSSNTLAQIQCHQLVHHLEQLERQAGYISAYQEVEYRDARGLAFAMLERVSGGEATQAAVTKLRHELDRAGAQDDEEIPDGFADRANAINGAIEALLRAASKDGERESRDNLVRLAVKAGLIGAQREQMRLDPDIDMAKAVQRWRGDAL